jgi:hypothetical protein
MPKIRADVFFRLKQGEFVIYVDGKDKKVQFKLQRIERKHQENFKEFSKADLLASFKRIYDKVRLIFN